MIVAVGAWAILRLLTSFWAALVSAQHPIQPIEERVALLPSSTPSEVWAYRFFISPLQRWDVEWYRRILVSGYLPEDGTASFHPLFPWLAKPLYQLGMDPVVSLLMVSSLAGLGLLLIWLPLARLDLNEEDSRQSLFFFLFSPLAFVLFVPYTESSFLLFSALGLYWIRRGWWFWGGVAGALAALTRQQGLVLIFFILWEMWRTAGGRWRSFFSNGRGWAAVGAILVAFAGWLAYRGVALADLSFQWKGLESFLHSFLISSSHKQVVPVFQFMLPWKAIGLAFTKLWIDGDVDIATNLFFGFGFLTMFVAVWKELYPGYRIYSLALILIALSYHTGPSHPYMGLLRHLWLAFPVYFGLARKLQKPWARVAVVGAGGVGMMFLLMLYVLESWVP